MPTREPTTAVTWRGWLAGVALLAPFVVVVLAVALAVTLAALVLLIYQLSPAIVWFSRLPEVLG
jgi:hypothetical protein